MLKASFQAQKDSSLQDYLQASLTKRLHRMCGWGVGIDQMCFFFYPFCFSFLLKFSTYFVPILLLITLILLLMMKSCCINLLHLYLLPS